MALVAYSDESDLSDSENNEQPTFEENVVNSEFVERENNDITGKSNLLLDTDSKIPLDIAIYPPNEKDIDSSITDNVDVNTTDILDDVPTLKTWHIKPVNVSETHSKGSDLKLNSRNKESKSKISKLKFVLPALSEFEDEDEDLEEDTSVRKKLKPSDGGTGLFAILPKPRGPTSLVPLHVSRPPIKVKPRQQKKIPKATPIGNKPDSGEEDISDSEGNDFFSLSDTRDSTLPCLPSVGSPSLNMPSLDIRCDSTSSVVTPPIQEPSSIPTPLHEQETLSEPASFIPFEQESEAILTGASRSSSNRIDEEALLRLAGRRNKGQVPNFIDIKADDALMSREEWVTRALCDEKPKKSFSKKREGNPTQQQKRKHQITYLAHQAQEREQDLQNTWGQNRFTKMQTQSKYGF